MEKNLNPTIAAIDLGSNGIRLSIAQSTPTKTLHYQIIHQSRKPIRLGTDAFSTGLISQSSLDQIITALQQFRSELDQHHVQNYRAIATSAARNCSNISQLTTAANTQAQIKLEVITPHEEATLLHQAIQSHHQINPNQPTLILDMGGGSIELILTQQQNKITIQSLPLGPVRLLQTLTQENNSTTLNQLLQPATQQLQNWLNENTQPDQSPISTTAYAVGGNIEALADSRNQLIPNQSSSPHEFDLRELQEILSILNRFTTEERMAKSHWHRDRADIIEIAAEILLMIMQQTNLEKLRIPRLSIRDGILTQLFHRS